MKPHLVPTLSAFFGAAAVAAAALPEPSATIRVQSLDALFTAASAVVAECAGPALASQLVGGARDTVAGFGAIDPAAPITAACWAAPSAEADEVRIAALLSIPTGPAGAGPLCGMLGLSPDDVSAPVAIDALPFPAALVSRDGRLLLALATSDELPEGVPASPAEILAESAGVFAAEPLRADALLEIRTGSDLSGCSWLNSANAGDDSEPVLREVAELLEESCGIANALPALRTFAEALKADSAAVAGSTFDVWVEPGEGLFLAAVVDFDPQSPVVEMNAGRTAISPSDLPSDVGADAFCWGVSATPDRSRAAEAMPALFEGLASGTPDGAGKEALALSAAYARGVVAAAKQIKSTSYWVAPDAEGRPYFSARIETADGGAALREVDKPAREIAGKLAAAIPGTGIAAEKTESGETVTVPVASAVSAAVAAIAKAAEEVVDADDAARIASATKYLERIVGATNVLSVTSKDGAFAKDWHALGAERPAGAPASPAAFALASRAPAGLAPVSVGEGSPSRVARAFLKLFPEAAGADTLGAATLFAGVPVSMPVRVLCLAGGPRAAVVGHVPMSEAHFLANLFQVVAIAKRDALFGDDADDVGDLDDLGDLDDADDEAESDDADDEAESED